MAVSPYTLNNLYNQGTIDYVPYELTSMGNVSSLNAIQNPYLNAAMQGSMYQNYGNMQDSFQYTAPTNYDLGQIGSRSQAGINAYGFNNIGGEFSNAGMNAYGMQGIGTIPQNRANIWGGFNDLGNTFNQVKNNTPNFLKGLLSLGVVVGTLGLLFSGKKAPSKPINEAKTNFFSRIFHRK